MAASATQDFVPIKEIRDGVVILTDGTMRAVLIASSVNFALKSDEEKTAILFQYQNFLNSVDFTTQIFIQSRRLDISPYIDSLEKELKDQPNELLKVQTREYIDFIKKFTESTNIMTKTFFIVVPYEPPLINNKESLISRLNIFKAKPTTATDQADFEEYRSALEQRVDVVASGLSRCGVRTQWLGTEEVIELFFKLFNPGEHTAPTIEK
jgi:hypothetical protein